MTSPDLASAANLALNASGTIRTQPAPGRGLIALLCALVACGPLAIDMYLPALPQIASDLGTTGASVQQTLTGFLLGFGLGMLFAGPLSDSLGRRVVLQWGLVLFVAGSAACVVATDIVSLQIARAVQALGGGAAVVLARALARDAYGGERAAEVLSHMAAWTAVAPLVAPLLGAGLLTLVGWRAVFVVLAVWGLALLVWLRHFIPAGAEGGRRGLLDPFRTYRRLLADAPSRRLLMAGAGCYGALFAYLGTAPFIFIERFGWTPSAFAFLFSANVIGIVAASIANARAMRRFGTRTLLHVATGIMTGGGLLVCLSAPLSGEWALLLIVPGLAALVAMVGPVGANTSALLMARFPENAGTAVALLGGCQFAAGAALGGVPFLIAGTSPWGLGVVAVGCSLTGCLLLGSGGRKGD